MLAGPRKATRGPAWGFPWRGRGSARPSPRRGHQVHLVDGQQALQTVGLEPPLVLMEQGETDSMGI
jgi:hypothetical protein